jgi:hypothetical protein
MRPDFEENLRASTGVELARLLRIFAMLTFYAVLSGILL